MNLPINTIFFDVYNTLAGFYPPRELIQKRAAAEYNLKLTDEGITRGYHFADAFFADENSKSPIRLMNNAERLIFFSKYEQIILKEAGFEVNVVEAKEIWEKVRAQNYDWKLFDDVPLVLRELQNHGYKTAAITNMPYGGDQVKSNLGLDGLLEFIVTSSECKAEKPSPIIFQTALEKAGINAEMGLMVGDNVQSDLEGAESVGMRSVLIDRYRNFTNYISRPRITTMKELIPLIGKLNDS